MKVWTQDSRPLVWTANEAWTDTLPLYDLYIHGRCVADGLTFEAFNILYTLYHKKGI